jgi:putative PIN family toxin of toxin-antitoxin system
VRVVLDANVVFAGAGWRGEAHSCLLLMARRRITAFATEPTLEELRALVAERGSRFKHSAHNLFSWYYSVVKMIEPAALGKQRSRDVKDDPYLACALAARAKFIVTRDDDLLALGKPFGIGIVTPRELLTSLARPI